MATLLTCLLTLAAWQDPAQGSPTPEHVARFFELCETTRRGAILQVEHQLRRLRNATEKSGSASSEIAKLENQLATLRSGRELLIPTISFPPQVGAIGRLPGDTVYVDQVISAKEVAVRCQFRVPVTTVRNRQAYREVVVRTVPFVIRGWRSPTARAGSDLRTTEIFEVLRRENYRTNQGRTRSLLVLRPFDVAAARGRFEAQSAHRER